MSLGPLMIDLKGTSVDAEEREWLQAPSVGGVILFSRNFTDLDQLRRLVADIHAIRQPGLLVAVDQEGGRVQRFRSPFFELPPPRSIGRLYDAEPERALDAARAFGWLMAAELRAVGVDLSFAPVVDLDLGLADVIGDRALHADAAAVTELALRFLSGMQLAGMPMTAKHFPTHAGVTADSHTETAVDRRTLEELDADLAPYRRLIRSGLQAVMVAHVGFPRVDPLPASFSSWWIREQLRGALGFSGAVLSDDISMLGAAVVGSCSQRIEKALEAGCDIVLLCNSPADVPAAIDALQTYVSPPGQLRLMRLRGRQQEAWDALRAGSRWRRACERVQALRNRPDLELEG